MRKQSGKQVSNRTDSAPSARSWEGRLSSLARRGRGLAPGPAPPGVVAGPPWLHGRRLIAKFRFADEGSLVVKTSFAAGVRGDVRRLCQGKSSRAERLLAILFNRGFHALLLHRAAHASWKARIPVVPLLLTRLAQFLFAVDLAYQAELGPGIVIVHGFGLVVGSAVRIEGNCCLFHGVTLGDRGTEWVGSQEADGHPVVEAGCIFGAGAKVLGPIRIGRNSVIGANAVVLKDVAPCSIAAGVPARVIGRRPEMDENLRPILPIADETPACSAERELVRAS